MRSVAILSLCTAAIFTTPGCSETEVVTPVAAASNTNCPIMGHKVTDDGGRATWNDETIGFCCPGCIKKWEALSDTEKAEKLASADSGDPDSHEHGDHDHAEDTEAG